MVLMCVSLLHSYLPLNEEKLNTKNFLQSLAKQNLPWKIEGKGPKTCLTFGIYKNHDCLFCVQTNISFCAVWKVKCLFLCVRVFVYVSHQKMPGMRQSTDLILPFPSVCLQKSAGEREMHTPNTHHILNLHCEICLTLKYFIKYWLSCRKMTFWFTFGTACRSCASPSFQPNRFLYLSCSRTCSRAKPTAAGAWVRNALTWYQTTPDNKARLVTLKLFV